MNRKNILILIGSLFCISVNAQTGNHSLIGYFQNWQDVNAPYIQLDNVDQRYDIIDVAFAIPQAGTDYKMEFIPDQVSQATFITQIQTLHNQGKKVIISIGGATAPVSLNNISERDTFISTMTSIINTYSFDGIDIDLEGSSLSVSGGTIAGPVDQPIINLVFAIKQIMANYYSQNNHRLILTMAPETAFVHGGQSAYGGIWGAYLPVIDALRDSIEILHVQLYNSGSMYGIDGGIYSQGTADFIVAMCEAVIQGFNTAGGSFAGLPASKVAIGLPACSLAAGGGYTAPDTVEAAINYLTGNGPQPGAYLLLNSSGYPDLRGMMTWSINWDAVNNCATTYEYADTYENIFGTATSVQIADIPKQKIHAFPNPTTGILNLNVSGYRTGSKFQIFDSEGKSVMTEQISASVNMTGLQPGIYCLVINDVRQVIVKQ